MTTLFTYGKTDLQYNCVETVMWLANGSMENLPKGQSTRTKYKDTIEKIHRILHS